MPSQSLSLVIKFVLLFCGTAQAPPSGHSNLKRGFGPIPGSERVPHGGTELHCGTRDCYGPRAVVARVDPGGFTYTKRCATVVAR
jgi:hypothetical protein